MPALAEVLELHVRNLASRIGERNLARPEALNRAALYVEQALTAVGGQVSSEPYRIDGESLRNLSVETPGESRASRLVVGAHYDTAPGTPGADDNASAVAVLIETAGRLLREPPPWPVRFVAFASEEPPHFGTPEMGSFHHARRARERGEDIRGMLSLEMVGFFDARPGSQSYPPLLARFYPDAGDFLALVGNLPSWGFIRRFKTALTHHGLRLESACLPRWIPGVSLSDQRSFWAHGYPAAMLTDTAMYRNPNYHQPGDTADTLDYARMAALVDALVRAIPEVHGPIRR